MEQKIIIDPNMENQDLWNFYFSHKTLKRKYIDIDGIKTPIELSHHTMELIKKKKKQIMKNCFERYHQANRERYNEFYRKRYHEKKVLPIFDENIQNK
jgi:hypothetical protein